MDPWWNPAVEEQAIDRAHRLGSEKPTFIYRMVTQGTIEERVRELQFQKKETFRQVIGDLEKPSGLADHFSSLQELIELKELTIWVISSDRTTQRYPKSKNSLQKLETVSTFIHH